MFGPTLPDEASISGKLRHPSQRAGLTNDPRRLRADIDMRSPDGRLFADIYDALAFEFADAGADRIRDIAVLRFSAEKAVAVGAFEDVVRLHNTRRSRTASPSICGAYSRWVGCGQAPEPSACCGGPRLALAGKPPPSASNLSYAMTPVMFSLKIAA